MADPPQKPMRQLMPETAAFIDRMREAFGKADIDAAIRVGGLYAEENGQVIGERLKGQRFEYE